MGTRQGNSAGMTHAMTTIVPSNRSPNDTTDETLCTRVLSSVAVSLVKRWITRPAAWVEKRQPRVRSALNSARCRWLAAARDASAHANVRAQLTAACPMPIPAKPPGSRCSGPSAPPTRTPATHRREDAQKALKDDHRQQRDRSRGEPIARMYARYVRLETAPSSRFSLVIVFVFLSRCFKSRASMDATDSSFSRRARSPR